MTLRAQKSSLLGFGTHADYVLEMNMAKTSQTVATFLGNRLSPPPCAVLDCDEMVLLRAPSCPP